MTGRLFAFIQPALPQHLISRTVGWLARTRWWPVRTLLIGAFLRLFPIDLEEAENPDPASYVSFNALFTRALRPGARTIDPAPAAVVAPVDGTVSQCGVIAAGRVLQAKGRDFTVTQLLGGDSGAAAAYTNGTFATIYLAPHNYHRIHLPVAATLTRMTHVPGRLFSVSPATTAAIDRLFARNERVVFHLHGACGPVALVMVGALNVGGIETVHHGVVTPAARGTVKTWHYDPAIPFARAQELARFNLGSTVVLLFAEHSVTLADSLKPAQTLQVGQRIATAQAIESI